MSPIDRKYESPPVREAVFQADFAPSAQADEALLTGLKERFGSVYSTADPVQRMEAKIQLSGAGFDQSVLTRNYVRYSSPDHPVAVELTSNRIIISAGNPYPGWEVFRPRIEQAVQAYCEVASPPGFLRLGLRYVNQLDILQWRVDLEDYLNFYPFTGRDFGDFGLFNMSLHFEFEGGKNILRLSLGTGPVKPEGLSFLLDLDYFLARPGELPIEGFSAWLTEAKVAVKSHFEAAIKDTLRKLFKEREV